MNHPSTRGIVYIMVAAIFFATMGACLKFALQGIPLYETIFFRAAMSSLIIGGVMRVKGVGYWGSNRKYLLARSLAGFIAMSCIFYSLTYLPLADAAVLQQTAPLFVALLSIWFLGEHVTPQLLMYLLLGLFGVVLVLQPEGKMLNVYGLIALLGAFFSGLAYVFVRRLHQTDNSWVIAFHFASITAVLAFPVAVWQFVWPSPSQWLALVGAGLLGTGGQIFMTTAYRYEEASKLAPFSYIAIFLAFIYGIIFWSEIPDKYMVFGAILIILSGLGAVRFNWKQRQASLLADEA